MALIAITSKKGAAAKIQTMCRDIVSLVQEGPIRSYGSLLSLTGASPTGRPS